jgi:hypothetical protein
MISASRPVTLPLPLPLPLIYRLAKEDRGVAAREGMHLYVPRSG